MDFIARHHPFMEPLRSHARFAEMVRDAEVKSAAIGRRVRAASSVGHGEDPGARFHSTPFS